MNPGLPKFEIPTTAGHPLPIPLSFGSVLFIVGANGSGKSALLQHVVGANPDGRIRRISAHRQTWLKSGNINITPETRRQFSDQFYHYERAADSRWRDEYAEMKQSAVIFDLVAKDNARARKIADFHNAEDPEGAEKTAREVISPFSRINDLLKVGKMNVSLKVSEGEQIFAQRPDGAEYSIAEMSDGERNATILAATVLTVEERTALLIDEPERHLHPSIIQPLLSALFQERKDCAFLISTHDLELPVSNPGAGVLLVRSCTWEGNTPKSWDVTRLEIDAGLPEETKREIMGARRKILFVEGTSSSVDGQLYGILFPTVSVIPKESCRDVMKAVSGLRETQECHHVEAFGLIDRDDRSDSDIAKLPKFVYALEVCSAEAFLYCSDAIRAVAAKQAEGRDEDPSGLVEAATEAALAILAQDKCADEMAARRCERTMRDAMMLRVPTWKKLLEEPRQEVIAKATNPFHAERERFTRLVQERRLDELVARYPLKKSSAFNEIAKSLRCPNKHDYEIMALSRIRHDDQLAETLRCRLGKLSQMLGG